MNKSVQISIGPCYIFLQIVSACLKKQDHEPTAAKLFHSSSFCADPVAFVSGTLTCTRQHCRRSTAFLAHLKTMEEMNLTNLILWGCGL